MPFRKVPLKGEKYTNRTIIYLTNTQQKDLAIAAAKKGCNVSQLIRELIDVYLESTSDLGNPSLD